MLITKDRFKIDVPDGWVQTDEKNLDYYESPDGARGIYLTSHEKNDLDSDKKVIQFVMRIEKDKTKSMKGYKFRSQTESIRSEGGAMIGHLDQYDQTKNYRIVSKCIVKQQKIYRAVLHDYDCLDYKKSQNAFDRILDSFVYFPKYTWKSVPEESSQNLNEAIVVEESGFLDIDFFINSHSVNKDGSFLVNVSNLLKGEQAGFAIYLGSKWASKKIENSREAFYWGNGRFINTGKNTDKFIEILSRLYGTSLPSINQKEIEVVIVGLANDPRKFATREVKMKFFFNSDSDNQELYSEIFVNINLAEQTLEFHEKDPEYRQPLIRSLCGET